MRGRGDGSEGRQGASNSVGGGVGDSLGKLVRETADGLGELVVQHVKLAQLDLTANFRAMASRAAALAVCGVLIVVGYTLTMVGVGLLLGGGRTAGGPLLGIGVAHLLGAGISMLVMVRRLGRAKPMNATAAAIGESARTVLALKPTAETAGAIARAPLPAVSRPESAAGASAASPRLEQARVL